ncbi:hypothetical protein [Rhodococcus sp. F64268]|uniref:hypothetical protein n=1 Tax=Rhodococcus sp. F64268 TaxID=2926402 RepID=UPI001FF5CB09|nr:hypothetical protein [Rhodococcus sp. F64268]
MTIVSGGRGSRIAESPLCIDQRCTASAIGGGIEMGSIASLLTDVLVGVILELISSGSAQ